MFVRAWKRIAISSAFICASICAGIAGCEYESPRPDVVLISIDTLRADHMGIYGYPRNTTPRIDHFFRSGTAFTAASSTAPCTYPAVRQFLYGAFDVRSDRKSLAELLQEIGYTTAAVLSQHQYYRRDRELYARGFAHYDLQGRDEVDQHGMTSRRAGEVSDRAIAWIERQPPGASPYFLWLHYFDPHDPYEPPPAFRAFDLDNGSNWTGDIRTHLRPARTSSETRTALAERLFDPLDTAHFVNLYDGEIGYTDAQIGRVLDALDATSRPKIVILISDHAEFLGEEHQWGHCKTLEEIVIRVPFLIRDELTDSGGRQIDLPVSTLDLLPTIAGRLGIDTPSSLYPGVELERLDAERSVLAFWKEDEMVRRGRFKQIFTQGKPIALYDLSRDPREQSNLIEAKLAVGGELEAVLAETGDLPARIRDDSRESIKLLQQIGYIE